MACIYRNIISISLFCIGHVSASEINIAPSEIERNESENRLNLTTPLENKVLPIPEVVLPIQEIQLEDLPIQDECKENGYQRQTLLELTTSCIYP